MQTDKRFFSYMMREVNGADNLAAKEINFINDPVEMMRNSYGCCIQDYITTDEMKDSMEWIIDNYFSGKDNFEDPVFITLDMIKEFIKNAVNEICRRLK